MLRMKWTQRERNECVWGESWKRSTLKTNNKKERKLTYGHNSIIRKCLEKISVYGKHLEEETEWAYDMYKEH